MIYQTDKGAFKQLLVSTGTFTKLRPTSVGQQTANCWNDNMIRWFLFFLSLSTAVFGQQVIEGKVVDKETGKPVPFASIGIVGSSQGTSSNLNGQFSLAVSGSASIKVTCVGYESQVINSLEEIQLIQLTPIATQLGDVYIYDKAINAKKVVRKAFASISDNYDNQSFLQRFFYRQYSTSDSVYERLVEASVDVWKNQGYRSVRRSAGEREEMRITQLRRSLDIKGMVQGQTPVSLGYILQTDIAGYQTPVESPHVKLFDEASNLRTDFENYIFTFEGITNYDGQEVYKINYEYKKDSVLTTTGYVDAPHASGSLFITTDRFAFVKTEDIKYEGTNTIRTSGYYRKYADKYYPYHFIREGANHYQANRTFHIELMSVEIRQGDSERFASGGMTREDLLKIPYDSSYWNNTTILKTTPLEDDIIHDLGGGSSLNKQFYLYKQYELNVTDGGNKGEEKFNWLVADSKDKRVLYVCFWDSDFKSYLVDMEYFKRLNLTYKGKITFVLVSLESDEARWKQLVKNYNYFSDGMINYRINRSSEILKNYSVKKIPAFILISKDGKAYLDAKRPSDPLLEKDLKRLID